LSFIIIIIIIILTLCRQLLQFECSYKSTLMRAVPFCCNLSIAHYWLLFEQDCQSCR